MRFTLTIFIILFLLRGGLAQMPKLSNGLLYRFQNFHSDYVTPRNVDVWLPDGYDSLKHYAVVYMQDGQMLFDSNTTWNRQEWQVDETVGELLRTQKIRDCIIVGIWNNSALRHAEYMPRKPFESLDEAQKNSIRKALNAPAFEPVSDAYLRFLVTELKPFIDGHFATERNRKSTFIAGSSMGGLISLYAVCEYPTVFGGAACLSTHWTGIFRNNDNPFPQAMLAYLEKHLPDPKTNRLYFDRGTETLDSLYKTTQLKVDALLKRKDFDVGWKSLEFPGRDHSEKAWADRLQEPLEFLLPRYSYAGAYDGNPIVWDNESYWGNVKSVESVSYFATDTARKQAVNGVRYWLRFNENWQVSSAMSINARGDTTGLPVPVYNESGEPVLSVWLKENGGLNSFSVQTYNMGKIEKTTEYSSYGSLSHVTDYTCHGDTTIAVKCYYNSLSKTIDRENWEKTVTVTRKGNVISNVCTEKNGIQWAIFIEYTRFDKYGNWTEGRFTGEFLGEKLDLITLRNITYYP